MNCGIFKIKEEKTLEERMLYSQTLMRKHPGRIPIIIEKNSKCGLPSIDRSKYLVPNTLTVSQLVQMIRKQIQLEPSNGIFVFINNKLVPNSATISEVYATEKEEDGFLYAVYSQENAFG